MNRSRGRCPRRCRCLIPYLPRAVFFFPFCFLFSLITPIHRPLFRLKSSLSRIFSFSYFSSTKYQNLSNLAVGKCATRRLFAYARLARPYVRGIIIQTQLVLIYTNSPRQFNFQAKSFIIRINENYISYLLRL